MISNLDEDEDIELIWWYIYKKNIKNICLNKYKLFLVFKLLSYWARFI